MSKPRSRLINYSQRSFRTVRGFTTELHFGRQAKHDPNHREFGPGKSPISLEISELQDLVEEYAGTGVFKSPNREVVTFPKTIGYFRYEEKLMPTSRGTIHYSKSGAHIVPARPRKARR